MKDSGKTCLKRIQMSCVSVIILIGILFVQNSTLAESAGVNILFVLDGSGSMWGRLDDVEKIVIAKDVMTELVNDLPEGVNIGLEVYGHRRKGDCGDIEMLSPIGQHDTATIIKQIQSINPKGKTPITGSIMLAAEHLGALEEEATIVLVSDGEETCEGDPCDYVKMLKEKGINFTMHVVGFDVNDEQKAQLACIAEAGGGLYFAAQNAAQLQEAFTEVKTEVIKKVESPQEAPPKEPVAAILAKTRKEVYLSNEPIVVDFMDLPGYEKDWITIVEQGTPDNKYAEYFYTKGKKAGNFTFTPLPAGEYEVRVYFNESAGGYIVRSRYNFQVEAVETGQLVVIWKQDQQYTIYDAATGHKVKTASTNQEIDLLPGAYTVSFQNQELPADIQVNEKTVLEPQEQEKKTKTISLTAALGIIQLPVLQARDAVDVHDQASGEKVATIYRAELMAKVKPGTYKLRFEKYFLQNIEVQAGQTTEVALGTIQFATFRGRNDVRVFEQETGLFVGKIYHNRLMVEVPEGTYKVQFGDHVLEGIEVGIGEPTLVELGAISIPGHRDHNFDVYTQDTGVFAGTVYHNMPLVEFPAGVYKIKFKKIFLENIVVETGNVTTVPLGAIGFPELKGHNIDVYTQEGGLYAGKIYHNMPALPLPAGTYKLKFGKYFLENQTVETGKKTDIKLGVLSFPNPEGRNVEVYLPDRKTLVGTIYHNLKVLSVPAGTYSLKLGEQFITDFAVEAGEEVVLEMESTPKPPNQCRMNGKAGKGQIFAWDVSLADCSVSAPYVSAKKDSKAECQAQIWNRGNVSITIEFCFATKKCEELNISQNKERFYWAYGSWCPIKWKLIN